MVNTFSSGKLTAHRHGTLFLCTKIPFWHRVTAALEYRLSVDSQTIQRSVSALSAACFCSQQTRFRLLYIALDPFLGSPSEWRYCDRFFWVTSFCYDCQHPCFGQNPGNHLLNALFSDYPSHFLYQLFSFEFLLHKYKIYFDSLWENKNEISRLQTKSTHPSLDGC